MHNVDFNIQESHERLLCTQEQSRGAKQARSFPQVKRQASQLLGMTE